MTMPITSTAPIPAETGTGTFAFDNTFARELEGLYVPWHAAQSPSPTLLKLNRALAEELGLDADALEGPQGAAIFSGNAMPEGATPIAQAYAGHQFGGYSPQLGDGRALLLGEVIDKHGKRRDIAFKGSGRTPFSRGGDGKAALGPVLREYLIGEAMHALGVPTTRALAAVATGESVLRESGALPGAVLTRVAASHIRVGTFQFAAARREPEGMRRLADYVIKRHYPELTGQPDRHLSLLRAASEAQAKLIARWMNIGFIHGVMNTDNMTLSGETIDYGPCAFMDHYDPATVFSSIDTGGRYAYANQPGIARWNLARLAETLLPLIDEDAERSIAKATEVINEFPGRYQNHWLAGMRAKLGLTKPAADVDDFALASEFLATMEGRQVDFTRAFRLLADAAETATSVEAEGSNGMDATGLRALYTDPTAADSWLAQWQARLSQEPETSASARAAAMRDVNPIYVPRNHIVEEALAAAVQHNDLAPFEQLLLVLAQPFDERAVFARYAEPAPAAESACYRTFCGT